MGVFLSDAVTAARKVIEDQKKLDLYKHDIGIWAKDKLGIHLWSKQKEIAHALIENKKVAVKSCHGSGKSYLASVIVSWWVDTRYGTESIVVSTAPTYEQVNKILWEYIRTNHQKAGFLGRVTQEDEWKDDAGKVLGFGRKPSDTNQHGFQGIHRSNGVLAVLDESGGLADTIWTGVEAITTGKHDRILAIGNPDDINTTFGEIFHPKRGRGAENEKNFNGDGNKADEWVKITISAYDTPNFTGEYMPEEAKGGMVTPEWAEEKKRSWGEESPRYKSKVLGEFSEESGHNLFTQGTLNKGKTAQHAIGDESTPVLGVDVARMGEDYSVIYSFQDGVLRFVDKWNKTDSVTSAAKIAHWAHALGAHEVRIDGAGLGGPLIDMVAAKSDAKYNTVGILGNGTSPDIDQWINYRAFMFDDLRERMFRGEIDIDPDDGDLLEELGDLEYHFNNSRNSLQVEKKEEIRKRTGKSPDFADAAAYAAARLMIDPADPVSKLKPGQEYMMDMSEILADMEMQISPF